MLFLSLSSEHHIPEAVQNSKQTSEARYGGVGGWSSTMKVPLLDNWWQRVGSGDPEEG